MQMFTFQDGGFVLHKIAGVIHGANISAWYSPDGALLNAEYRIVRGNTVRPIPARMRLVREELQRKGALHKQIVANSINNGLTFEE